MSKPRLIILSDIFGTSSEFWMDEYRSQLNFYFDIIEYDSRALAEISSNDQEAVHTAFVNGGIERAVENLLKIESAEVSVLGFSVGGTIAWKFALQQNCRRLCLISATRLRNELIKPTSQIDLYFGEFETNGPSREWFQLFNFVPTIFGNEAHECYKTSKCIKSICSTLLQKGR